MLRPMLCALLLLVIACSRFQVGPPPRDEEPPTPIRQPTAVAGVTVLPKTATPRPNTKPTLAPIPGKPTLAPTPSASAAQRGEQLAVALGAAVSGPAEVGLVLDQVGTGIRVEHQATRQAPSGSVYKLLVAHEVLDRIDRGQLELDDQLTIQPPDLLEGGWEDVGDKLTIQQALDAMMGDSSNRAAFALLRTLGRPRVNQRLVSLGLRDSSIPLLSGDRALPGSPPHDEEYAMATPADLARLMRMVLTGQTLQAGSRAEFLRLLGLREDVEPLRRALPQASVLVKNGWLPGVRNVAGLVESPSGPVVVAAFVDAKTDRAAEDILEEVGRALARTLLG